ncbi:MAG TPA: FAD/NAD(P)-binding oxidoreductase [Acidobacteriaceae bacterium]|jgi:NADPH-dependent 2,4-dienoyl-CoA reductase/sulfur reductase-like enzyme|nr:FAD/NAD(P)-binding oxidoreductase [Acidobacteriaceae bacterium]
MNTHFQVVVIGAGPAGIAAATAAARAGHTVALLDDNPAPGGQIWRHGGHLPATAQARLAALRASSAVPFYGWRVIDHPAPQVIRAEHDAGCTDLDYDRLIIATGARERFLPFPGWTLPNVCGAGGLDALVRAGLPIAGKRVVVAGTGPLLFAVAGHLAAAGAKILAICEQAPLARLAGFAGGLLTSPSRLLQGAGFGFTARGARFHTSCWPVAAQGTTRLESVILRKGSREWTVPCDYLACGFHLVPNAELAELLGCRLDDGFVATDDLQQTSIEDIYCAGEPTSIGGVDLALIEGEIAGLAAAGNLPQARSLIARRNSMHGFVHALDRACALDPQLRQLARQETIVCRCEDVECGVLRAHDSWRSAKLHTRCGMGPCQGRVCGAAAEFLFGWTATSVRPPLFPALVSSLTAAIPQDPKENV